MVGGGKFTPCLKSSKKGATKLEFTPQLENHKTFQKKSKKNVDQIFLMMAAIVCQNLPKNGQIRDEFQNFVTNYQKMIS